MRTRCTQFGWFALSLLACLAPQAASAAVGVAAEPGFTAAIASELSWGMAFGLVVLAFVGRLMPRSKTASVSIGHDNIANTMHRREEGERVATLASATFEAIMIHRDGIVVDGNIQLARLLGRRLEDLTGASIYDFLRDGPLIDIGTVLTFNDDTIHELVLVGSEGEHIPVHARGRDIIYRGEKMRVGCIVDLRDRKEAEQRIRHLALHDSLTGLPNRALFGERLAALGVRTGEGQGFAVAMVDIDRFKDINDVHGHQAGDAVIRETAARLQAQLGAHDIVARLGGDEFAVILTRACFKAQVEDFGHRVLRAMAPPIDTGLGDRIQVGVSIGSALCPEHAGDIDSLIGSAEIALHHAKKEGRGSSQIFKAGMNDLIDKRRALETDLEVAIERGEFELYLQPRVCAATANIVAYEALLRWNHPQRGLVSPGDFIPVAEASGLIVALGEWVISQACRLSLDIEGRQISLNVSPLQFRSGQFVRHLSDALRRTGANASQIELEITESVLIEDDKRAIQVLGDLKRMGFAIALDDFGTGYSSLSYLNRYPFDTIKIDRSFVSNLGVVESTQVIVRSIIALGNGLGMRIVAEGVETIEEALFLTQAGCDELQGYLLGRPVKVGERLKQVRPAIATQLQGMAAETGRRSAAYAERERLALNAD